MVRRLDGLLLPLLLVPRTAGQSHVAWTNKVSTNAGPVGGRASMAFAQQSLTMASGGALADVLWMYGGISRSSPITYSSQLWGYTASTSTWEHVNVATNAPPALTGAAMCAVGVNLYIFGGANFGSSALNTLYRFDTAQRQWSQMSLSGFIPTARAYHGMTCSGSRVWVVGGEAAGGTLLSDTAALNNLNTISTAWSAVSATGSIPTARKAHSLTASNNKLYLFGGSGTSGVKQNDAYALDTSTNAWQSLSTTGEQPERRDAHTAAVLDEKLYVFGGADQRGAPLNDVRVLHLGSLRWSHPRSAGAPPTPRWGHVGALINQELYVYGGVSATQVLLGDVWGMSRHCVGRLELTDARGTFTANDEDGYRPLTTCSWHLAPVAAHRQVRLYFPAFALEDGKDYVRVYDGDSETSPRLLAQLTGQVLPQPIGSTYGSLLVVFTTDAAGSDLGFTAAYYAECTAGYHRASAAVEGDDKCEPCPAGHYASSPGLPGCARCDTHQYQPTIGSSSCMDCPGGSRAAFTGATSAAECVCYEGFHAPNGTGTPCVACPVGALCPGGGFLALAKSGFCQHSTTEMAPCCSPTDCPGGGGDVAACPTAPGAIGTPGSAACEPRTILTLVPGEQGLEGTTFAYICGILGGTILVCYGLGHWRGRRLGARAALRNYARKLRVAATAPQIGSYTSALAAEPGLGEMSLADAARRAPAPSRSVPRFASLAPSFLMPASRGLTSSRASRTAAGNAPPPHPSACCTSTAQPAPQRGAPDLSAKPLYGSRAEALLVQEDLDLETVHTEEARLVPPSPDSALLAPAPASGAAYLPENSQSDGGSPRGTPPVMHLNALQEEEGLLLEGSAYGGDGSEGNGEQRLPKPPTPMRKARIDPAGKTLAQRRGLPEQKAQIPGGGEFVGTCLVQMPDSEGRWQPVKISASMQGSPVGSQHPSCAPSDSTAGYYQGQGSGSPSPGGGGGGGRALQLARARFPGPGSVRSGAFEDLEEEDVDL